MAQPETLTIKDGSGKVIWDLESYKRFIDLDTPAPDIVNPSLWRNAQLNMLYGLLKVTDRIYQVRGYDLSNITFVQGDGGVRAGHVEPRPAAVELRRTSLLRYMKGGQDETK